MRPSRLSSGKVDLFRERLEAIIDPHHALVRLAGLVPWSRFDEAFGRFYRPIGRPAKPTRLMVGLHYLKHVHDLSDEEVVARWVENPYWQFFCGFDFFQHEAPLDASTMTRWRKRIGPTGLEEMLKASVGVALDTGVAKPSFAGAGQCRHDGAAKSDCPSDRQPTVLEGASDPGASGKTAWRHAASEPYTAGQGGYGAGRPPCSCPAVPPDAPRAQAVAHL